MSGLAAFGPPAQEDADPFPLRWGEVIPLHFILPNTPLTKVMILSQPSRRYSDSVAMIPELLQLGRALQGYIQYDMSERVVVVISADLAHTHLHSGPYGYSNASEPFDLAVGERVREVNTTALLVTAAGLVNRALSCGYTGMVMLHGMLEAIGQGSWVSRLYANYHPSYYGMMVASFLSKTQS
jgi:aromatic ring-opening dioxygenase LigB subunit